MGKDLVQQPAQPARRGGGAGRDRGLRRAESPFGRAGLSRELPSLGHPRCPDLGPSAQCHSGGAGGVTSFTAVRGASDPGCKPKRPGDGLEMPKALAQLPCRLPSPLPRVTMAGTSLVALGPRKVSPSAVPQLMQGLIQQQAFPAVSEEGGEGLNAQP